MKIYIQIVDTKTGIYQCGMINEPVKEEFQVLNALKHFGVNDTNWITKETNYQYGIIEGTSKVVSVIKIE